MSSMGREADAIAAKLRQRARRHAARAHWQDTALRFAVATLSDKSIPDADARRTALRALSLIVRR